MIIASFCFLRVLRSLCGKRYDGSASLPYWRARDFSLSEKRFFFRSGKNLLSGSKYFYGNSTPKALIVFFHGLGDGRDSYIKEISLLAKEGYLVYAYDNTGCMESEGKTIVSFDHSFKDQEAFFSFLDKDEDAKGLRRYAVGHSWGGFNALISSKTDYRIEKIVSLAGYTSLPTFFGASMPRFGKFFYPSIWLASRYLEPLKGSKSAIPLLKKSKAEVLYIQGEDDHIVPLKAGFIALRKAFYGNPRFHFVLVKGIGHSVYRTPESEAYVHSLLKEGITELNKNEGLSMSLEKATQENEEVWKAILDFLNK